MSPRSHSSPAELPCFSARLPWYDLPEMHAANDALWSAVAGELRALGIRGVPPAIDRIDEPGQDATTSLFTQICRYPLLTTARDRFSIVGTPRYRVPGCTGALHRSFIVVRDDARASSLEHLRGTRFAVNEVDSNTGMNLPRHLFAPLHRAGRFFASTILTGSHAASAALVTAGDADAAALDCITFAFLARYRPAAVRRLRVIAHTQATPVPPFVTGRDTDVAVVAALRRALIAVCEGPAYSRVRDALFLDGLDLNHSEAGAAVLEYEREARRLGYPELK